MIPADHWHDNDNGTAWVVCPNEIEHDSDPDWLLLAFWHGSHRPCDTCGGKDVPRPHDGWKDAIRCPDCINGRHTFEIEVETFDFRCGRCRASWSMPLGMTCDSHDPQPITATHRVSIVPGMVLPIVLPKEIPSSGAIADWGSRFAGSPRFARYTALGSNEDGEAITLPPAAAPGTWAVLLNLTPEGTTP